MELSPHSSVAGLRCVQVSITGAVGHQSMKDIDLRQLERKRPGPVGAETMAKVQ